ncbi:orotidine-5'-phosphate decarboxylase [Arthrobacter pigmenti]|uniref:Orotidine 5'-phosphate decarboxylase n=1 Tax=Arthrobacter pigmenti TaxID=271432 RepID=A0A846RRW0_9MICC|nr:orotidine-5'-phosphate decarboxylase [Arthrobacter pigmenti]NJC22445.1 orotidine-5'-phosphate decarboxylase [Arthrobacter pigmenti]
MPEPRATFGARLASAVEQWGSLCVGVDPHPSLLEAWGLDDTPEGLRRFSHTVLDAVSGRVSVIKPQVALFERHGSRGFAVLEDLLARSAANGLLTIADAKRGDIGSTMAGYADAWLRDGSALAADAITLSPYLGFESLRPALTAARESGRGVFVLALTSNPEGASVQHVGGENSVAQRIVRAAAQENLADGPGSVGLVIGATAGKAVRELRLELESLNGPILAPGVGAQGAGRRELDAAFAGVSGVVLPNSSREILRAGPDVSALKEAVEATQNALRTPAEAGSGTD